MLKGLARKIFITVFVGIFLLCAYFIVFSYNVHIHVAEENKLNNLQSITNTLAAQIEGIELQIILETNPNKDQIQANDDNFYYQKIHKTFQRTQDLNKLPSPIYTLSFDSTRKELFFGVSSAEIPYFRHSYTSFPKLLVENYERGGTLPAYEDEHGIWLSAFSPVFYKDKVIAVVMVDLPFQEFIDEARAELFYNIGFSLALVLLICMLIYRLLSKVLMEDESRRLLIRKKSAELKIKNEEITSSLEYAKRIQEAILPQLKEIDKSLKNNFVYYKPKDIVAGDFYWLGLQNDKIFLAAADCTGHGVPGAMVSVICSKALDQALKEYRIDCPAKMLDKVSQLVEEAFENSEADIYDGMDICLVLIDRKNKELSIAGAQNSLYQIKQNESGESELVEHKTDKQPIGKYPNKKPFTPKKLDLVPGEYFYLFTDGFADQFGGERGKKFLYKPFKSLLLKNHRLTMQEQKQELDAAFEEWRGDEEQVDDVCVIGFQV